MKAASISILVFSLAAQLAVAGDFWPVHLDATYHYISDDGTALTVEYIDYSFGYSGRKSRCIGPSCDYTLWEYFDEDEEGNTLLVSSELYVNGNIDFSYSTGFFPPVLFVDASMGPGSSWTTASATENCFSRFEMSVTEIGTVSVPAGTFEVHALAVENTFSCPAYPSSGTYLVNRGVGPVVLPGGLRLVAIERAVPTIQETWSALKAQYR